LIECECIVTVSKSIITSSENQASWSEDNIDINGKMQKILPKVTQLFVF